jgi:hypothetical protein
VPFPKSLWPPTNTSDAIRVFGDIRGGPIRDRQRHCYMACIELRRNGPLFSPWVPFDAGRKAVQAALGGHVLDRLGDIGADITGALCYPMSWRTCEELCNQSPFNRQ